VLEPTDAVGVHARQCLERDQVFVFAVERFVDDAQTTAANLTAQLEPAGGQGLGSCLVLAQCCITLGGAACPSQNHNDAATTTRPFPTATQPSRLS